MTVPLTEDKPDNETLLERHFSLEPLTDREPRRIGPLIATRSMVRPTPPSRLVMSCPHATSSLLAHSSPRRRAMYADELPPAGGVLDLRQQFGLNGLHGKTSRTPGLRFCRDATEPTECRDASTNRCDRDIGGDDRACDPFDAGERIPRLHAAGSRVDGGLAWCAIRIACTLGLMLLLPHDLRHQPRCKRDQHARGKRKREQPRHRKHAL